MGLLQAEVVLDGDQGVLQPVAFRHVVVDIVSGYRGDAQLAGQVDEPAVAGGVALHQVLLQFHEHVVSAEPVQVLPQLGLSLGVAALRQQTGHPACAAAGQQDQTVEKVRQVLQVQSGVLAVCGHIRIRDQVGKLAIAVLVLSQEGQVGAVFNGHLDAGDGLHLQSLSHLGEMHGPAQIIVVGQSQRTQPQAPGAHQQVLHGGGPFLEGIITVAVKFGVH